MKRSIYIVSPKADKANYAGLEVMSGRGYKPGILFGDVSIVTVAAMADEFLDVAVCDQTVSDVDYDTDADYVGITGKITQYRHMVEIATKFRERGKKIVIGGPLASLSPGWVRPYCDVLIKGEIEEISDQIFSDLASGQFKDEYLGDKPDLTTSPIPRWDLYPNERALGASIQTSRGCPYECEFCDAIVYNGRKQRFKNPSQVLAELDVVYRHGYRFVFLADDNVTVNRRRIKELLAAITEWNDKQQAGRVKFASQASIDVAQDDELLQMCNAAGLTMLFIGLETPNEASLVETKKRQNLKRDIVGDIAHLNRFGIMVNGGMIVGFDSDGPDIFGRQLEFATATSIPLFSCGALMAPDKTPLQARLSRQGRIKNTGLGASGDLFSTNIVHPSMNEAQLSDGLRWLVNSLYSPQNFGQRMLSFIERLGEFGGPDHYESVSFLNQRRVIVDSIKLVHRIAQLGPEHETMMKRVIASAQRKPMALAFAYDALVSYQQVQFMLEQRVN